MNMYFACFSGKTIAIGKVLKLVAEKDWKERSGVLKRLTEAEVHAASAAAHFIALLFFLPSASLKTSLKKTSLKEICF